MTDQQDEVRSSLRQFFTPTQPITLPDLLTGRIDTLSRVYENVLLPSQHVLLYGDRGVGKTSIARVVSALAGGMDDSPSVAIVVSCDTTDTFSTIWQKVLREIRIPSRPVGFGRTEGMDPATRIVPPESLTPNDIRIFVESCDKPLTVIVDEYDRVLDDGARRLMTDTIKRELPRSDSYHEQGGRCRHQRNE